MGGAWLGAGRIGIEQLLVEKAHVRRSFDRPGWCGLDLSCQIDIANAIVCRLRRGVGRAPILLQQLDWRRRRRTEIVVGRTHVEMKFADFIFVPDITVKATDIGSRKISESVVVQSFERAIYGKLIILLAPLRRTLDTSKRPAQRVDLGAVIDESILHLYIDRSTQRIETESRIIGHHGHRLNGRGRYQIPIDRVAERFVDAHPILVNRKSLGCACHGGSDEAAKLHVWLEWISRHLVDDDARNILLQSIRDIRRPEPLNLIYVNNVDACWHLFDVDARARYRSGRVQRRTWCRPGRDPWGEDWPRRSEGARRSVGYTGLGFRRRWRDHDGGQRLNVVGRALGVRVFDPGRDACYYQHTKHDRSSAHQPHPIALRLLGRAPVRLG